MYVSSCLHFLQSSDLWSGHAELSYLTCRETATPKKRALTLPCGHAFCEDCIDR